MGQSESSHPLKVEIDYDRAVSVSFYSGKTVVLYGKEKD